MDRQDARYQAYMRILEEELVPAMGCTEPISIAYAAAKAREVLGAFPERVLLEVSGSIVKNVKSVVVPNTGNLRGMAVAAVAGIVAGNPERELEVISEVTEEEKREINRRLDTLPIELRHLESGHVFDIQITERSADSYVTLRIMDQHTNIVLIEKDGETVFRKEEDPEVAGDGVPENRRLLNMDDIWAFVNDVEIEDVRELLDRQIEYNMAIAEKGLSENFGASIGSVLLNTRGSDIQTRAKAMAAAASDARMNGCELPVIINSGSGNQGITCSVPLVEYAKELQVSRERLYRALVLSNLVSIHEKTEIGTLSAYCGAVSAGAGAGAGIAYLYGEDYDVVVHTVINALAIVSGIICDGAKASCAAKIASALDAAILGYQMCKAGKEFHSGEGIVMNDVESTIVGVGQIGKDGMKETNEEIIRLMMKN